MAASNVITTPAGLVLTVAVSGGTLQSVKVQAGVSGLAAGDVLEIPHGGVATIASGAWRVCGGVAWHLGLSAEVTAVGWDGTKHPAYMQQPRGVSASFCAREFLSRVR